mgnify:CR=1 FL=1
MKTPQNRFFRLLLDSAWFPAVAWVGGVAVFLGAAIVAAPVRHWCGRWAEDGLGWAALGLVLVLSVAGMVAFVRSLLGRRWGRAAVQLLLGAVAVVLAGVGGICADFLAWEVASRTPGGIPWASTPGDAPMPFAIECRRAHPFLAEYDKQVAFPSGRRFGLYPDAGGYGDTAVYLLDSGRYAIAEGMRLRRDRRVYRIDPAAESVDFLYEGSWFAFPPDTICVSGCGTSRGTGWERHEVCFDTPSGSIRVTNGVPAGDEFAHRRYLGLAEPGGGFAPAPEGDGGDPWAEVLGSGIGR